VAEKVAAGLSTLVRGLQDALKNRGILFAARPVHAEEIAGYGIKEDPFADAVLLQLLAKKGIAYTFAISKASAGDIATRLRTESAKPKAGQA
jgi:hypothetical protein